jgi:hypothetical protein
MWEPLGPLPANVYWRRRAMAAAVAVVIVLLATLASTAFASPSDESAAPVSHLNPAAAIVDGMPSAEPTSSSAVGPTSTGAASLGAPASGGAIATFGDVGPTAPATAGAGAVPTTGGMAAPAVGSPATSGAVGAQTTLEGAPDPVPGVGTPPLPATSEQLRADETPRPAPVAMPVAVPPTGPVPCTNAMIAVAAEIDQPVHAVGQHPVFRLVITDTSAQPCVRDLDPSRQEIVVWSGDGKIRLWSSNDCGNSGRLDLRTLVPGQPVVFGVTWAGRTSTPGCALPRAVVPAGAYRLVSRLDGATSPATPFRLT